MYEKQRNKETKKELNVRKQNEINGEKGKKQWATERSMVVHIPVYKTVSWVCKQFITNAWSTSWGKKRRLRGVTHQLTFTYEATSFRRRDVSSKTLLSLLHHNVCIETLGTGVGSFQCWVFKQIFLLLFINFNGNLRSYIYEKLEALNLSNNKLARENSLSRHHTKNIQRRGDSL